ncbi:MAG: purine-nucleoside phosphorylase [Bdellovibrionota bacterium]
MENQLKKTKYFDRVKQSVEFLDKWNNGEKPPELALVLGSGLSNVIPDYSKMKCAHFAEIPGFKPVNVPGHAGEVRLGDISGELPDGTEKQRQVVILQGRNHAYEGNDPAEVVHNIRALIHWGVKGIILTNAAGCLNSNWKLGKMMLISDQINTTALSPIFGDYGVDFGPRFVDMSNCYNHSWQVQFKATATAMDEELYSGVYCGVLGPQYETPAEIKMIKSCGAQAVGMSTVLETIAARQMGAKVAGISCLTNYAAGLGHKPLDHEDVTTMAKKFAVNVANIVLNTAVNLEV